MAIEITSTEVQPEIVYNRFFLHELYIQQETECDDTAVPKYKLVVLYRMFGVDNTGHRHFHHKMKRMEIPDYYQAAMAKAMSGNMVLAGAMQAIEQALADIYAEQNQTSAQVVTI